MTKLTSVLDGATRWSVHYRKGRLIYDEGEPSKAVYRLDKGCVRLQVNGPDGDRQIVAFLFPGDLFGLCVDRRNSSAEAVTDVDLTHYALQSVLELSTRSPEVTIRLMKAPRLSMANSPTTWSRSPTSPPPSAFFGSCTGSPRARPAVAASSSGYP